MLKKIYFDKKSFEGLIVINKNKNGFQSSALLSINLFISER